MKNIIPTDIASSIWYNPLFSAHIKPAQIVQKLALPAFLLLVLTPVLVRLWLDYRVGGDSWRQADWLINFGAGPVRRGGIGEALIWWSDTTGLSLLASTVFLQGALFVAFVLLALALLRYHPHRSFLALLVASPAFCLIFWAGDPLGAFRKEIFGYLAFICLALCSVTRQRSHLLVTASVVLFGIGCVGNILHFFLTPALITGLYLLFLQGQISRLTLKALSILVTSISSACLCFAFLFKEVSDLAQICAPLASRNFEASFCDGALRWLVAGEVNHSAELAARLWMGSIARMVISAALGVFPLLVVCYCFVNWRMIALLVLISFAPMLILYTAAIDWGRWISLSYTITAFLVIQAERAGKLTLIRPAPWWLRCFLFTIALNITPPHVLGFPFGNAFESFLEILKRGIG